MNVIGWMCFAAVIVEGGMGLWLLLRIAAKVGALG